MLQEIDILNLKAQELYNIDPDRSIEISISAYKKATEFKYKKGELNSLLNLAGANYRKHNLNKSTEFLNKAEKKLLHTDFFKEWVKYNNLKGGIHLTNNSFDKATHHFNEAIRYAKLGKLYSSQILSMNNLAELKMKLSLYLEAINILQETLLLGKKHKDTDKQLFSYNLIALCYYNIRNYDLTLEYVNSTISLLQNNENHLIRIQIYNTKGGVHLKNKELKLANEAFKVCLKYSNILKATDFKINSMCNIGETYFEMKKYDKAEKYFLKSLNDSIKINHKGLEEVICCQLNQLYFYTKKFDQSIRYGDKALQLDKTIKSKHYARHAHFNNYNSYKALKNYTKALFHYEKYSKLEIEISKKQQNSEIKELNKNHKLKFAKLEIILEKEKNRGLALAKNKNKIDKKLFKESLTSKELELAKLYAKNFKRKEIAEQLNITVNTFDGYRTNIIKKLRLNGVDELISLCKNFF